MFAHTSVKCTEEPLRVPAGIAGGSTLYGMLHRPVTGNRGAVLLCPADGEERAWCLRTYVELARALASAGFWVLRFDYTGQGESGGRYEDATVETRVSNIRSALKSLADHSGWPSAVLVGARLGASLALEAAAGDPAVGELVLIEPILDGAAYSRNLIRVNLTMQMVLHEKVIRTSEQLLEDLSAGGRVSANGYNLTRAFLDSVEALRPADRLTKGQAQVLIIAGPSSRLPESPARVTRLAFAPFWKEPKADMTPPKALISLVVESMTASKAEVSR